MICTGAKRIADDEPLQAQVAACMIALLSQDVATGQATARETAMVAKCFGRSTCANGLMSASEEVGTATWRPRWAHS